MHENIKIKIRQNGATVHEESMRLSVEKAIRLGVSMLRNYGDQYQVVILNNGNDVSGWEYRGGRLMPCNPCNI